MSDLSMDTPRRKGRRSGDTRVVEIGKLFDKEPPVAAEAEKALLGALMLDWRACGEAIEVLSGPEDFHSQAHAAIYETLVALYQSQATTDPVYLKQRLADKGLLEQVGGPDYLVELYESVPSASAAGHYARLIREKAVVRRLIEAAGQTLDDCYNTAGASPADLLDKAGQRLFALQDNRTRTDSAALGALLEKQLEYISSRDGEGLTGLPTGFYDLDELTNGMHRGELVIIAARPSMGKTAFMLSIAEHMAVTERIPIGVFSLEMSKEQLAQRILCSRSRVDSHRLRKNQLGRDDLAALQEAVGQLHEAPMYVDDTPGITLMQMRAKARRMKLEHNIQALFVDYLQLMSERGFDSRQEEVGFISRGLKALARELDLPLLCLAQLNRGVEERGATARPRMSDLRESGSIEQDADVVMLIHREEYYHKADKDEWSAANPDKVGLAEIIVDKQRNGPTDNVRLHFDGATTAFRNLAGGRHH